MLTWNNYVKIFLRIFLDHLTWQYTAKTDSETKGRVKVWGGVNQAITLI